MTKSKALEQYPMLAHFGPQELLTMARAEMASDGYAEFIKACLVLAAQIEPGQERIDGYAAKYAILDEMGEHPAIKCFMCGMTSYNANDINNKYCGNCHKFLEDK